MSIEVKEDGEVVGMNNNEIIYPLLVSIQGDTKQGKTFFGASFPNAVILDFAGAKMGFSKIVPDPIASKRTVGEGFRSLFKPVRKEGGQVSWIPKIPGFDYTMQYCYIKSQEQFQTAIEKAKMFRDGLPEGSGKVWIVIDDTTRWRATEVLYWIDMNKKKFPIKEQWGQITQTMQSELTEMQNDFNVLLIHKTGRDFDTGLPVALTYPSNAEFVSDCNLEICVLQKDGKQRQCIKVLSNGHQFRCDNDYCSEILDPEPMAVLSSLRIPRELW